MDTSPTTSSKPTPTRKKYTRTRNQGCESCRRRSKKCDGIDSMTRKCPACTRNNILCLPWGSDHPHIPPRQYKNRPVTKKQGSQSHGSGQGLGHQASTNKEESDEQSSEAQSLPAGTSLPLPTIPVLPSPSSSASIMFVPMDPGPSNQVQNQIQNQAQPQPPVTSFTNDSWLLWEQILNVENLEPIIEDDLFGVPAHDDALLSHPDVSVENIQALLEFYLRIAESWVPLSLPPSTPHPIRSALSALHKSLASLHIQCAVASAYLKAIGYPATSTFTLNQVIPGLIPLPDSIEKMYYDAAYKSVKNSEEEMSIPNRLWVIIDLQLYHFIKSPTSLANKVLELGDAIVRSEFGESPEVALSLLHRQQTFGIRIYCVADVSRCLGDRGRRCLFNFVRSNRDSASIEMSLGPDGSELISSDTYMGIPSEIVYQLAKVIELVADMQDRDHNQSHSHAFNLVGSVYDQLDMSMIRIRAQAIEDSIKIWDPPVVSGTGGNGWFDEERRIMTKIWKATATIILYQSVYGSGIFHPVLRQAFGELQRSIPMAHHHSTTRLVPYPLQALACHLACPTFFASTLALSEDDRIWCRQMLDRCGPERVWRNNKQIVECLWAKMDENGWPSSWFDVMREKGLQLGFF